MPPISAILITFNEERDLPSALSSLEGIADEIVLVDSGSTDGTLAIAREWGARTITRCMEANATPAIHLRSRAENQLSRRVDTPFGLVSGVSNPAVPARPRTFPGRDP